MLAKAKIKNQKNESGDLPHYKFHKKHKILFGGFSLLIMIFIVLSSVALYVIYIKLEASYISLESRLNELEENSNVKFNEISENLISTQDSLTKTQERILSAEEKVSSLDNQFDELKSSASTDFSGVIEEAIPSVVTIRTNIAQGTGFIISDDGYLVTNAHVLVNANTVSAITYDKQTLPAEFIGYNADLDIALLKIDGTYNKLELADSEQIQVGEKVIAIGNPLGLQFSEGIVSAVHREGSNGLDAYVQTDAALNPGNSGGPLINKRGQVIGINNFKIGSGESLGFALESNYIEEVVNQISSKELNMTLV